MMQAMRIGINGSNLVALGSTAEQIVAHAVEAEADGFATWWAAQLAVPDALTLFGVIGGATSRIELGTAVVAIWTRHPFMLASQALTASELCGGRVTLGIGLAHKATVERMFGMSFEHPAAQMDEYLSVLMPVIEERKVRFKGEYYSTSAKFIGGPPGIEAPSVMLAAMGPRMLELAGSRTDGTILWLAGPRTIEQRLRPPLIEAAERAGRPSPRIVASVPVCVTDQPQQVRDALAMVFSVYNDIPSYRGVMETEGADGPADVSLVGDEATVRAGIERFAEAGATDFSALEFFTNAEEAAATRAMLREML